MIDRMKIDGHALPSLLDRLTQVSSMEEDKGLARFKSSIKRDLENFLNTRCYQRYEPSQGVRPSALEYGLSDFNSSIIDSPDERQKLREEIEQKLLSFFRYFDSLTVEVSQRGDHRSPTDFQLKISGILRIVAQAQPIRFTANMQAATRTILVTEHSDD